MKRRIKVNYLGLSFLIRDVGIRTLGLRPFKKDQRAAQLN